VERFILYLWWHPVLGHINQFVCKMLAEIKPNIPGLKVSSSLHPTLLTSEGLKETVVAACHLPDYT